MTRPTLRAPGRKPVQLRATHPSPGLESEYRRRLDAMLKRMETETVRTIRLTWEDDPPEMAADISPAAALTAALAALKRRWAKLFTDFAHNWGRRFTAQAMASTDRSFASSLRKIGFTVKFQMTDAMQDVFTATVSEQVNLIKSIPDNLLTQVQSHVVQSVTVGGDIGALAKTLETQFGVARRRAQLIARDQNNKATANFTMVRQLQVGITKARWLHSGGGRHPRPTHVKAGRDRVIYEVNHGWYDPHEKRHIYPGELINCRCVSISVIPGLEDDS